MSLLNKVIIVTGASSGIGAATARLLSKEGAKITIVGRNSTKLNKVAEDCKKVGDQPLIVSADVTKENEARTALEQTIKYHGKLDVLVNNAGIARYSNLLDENHIKVYDEIIDTNLRAPIFLSHLATPHLIKTKGNIVNVSSVAGSFIPNIPGITPYTVSKAGLDHFTRGTAFELAQYGIRVNAVCPGPVRTDIMENSGIPTNWDDAKPFTLLNRVAEPEEIADIILFLASDKAKGVTGSTFVSDNGLRLKH